ncbi:MAG: FYDLN acid domain-containing protein, partial [Myxococcota bacterium]|nr:FYDLN acid domain-containing protein [Myxococcota bacterium]
AKKAAAEKAAAKKAAAKKAAAEKAAAKKAAAEKAAAKKAAAKKAAAEKAAAAASKAAAKAAERKKATPKRRKRPARARLELRAGAGRPAADVSPLGTKWECFACGAKFYDLRKEEAICPKCETNQADRPRKTKKPTPTDPPIRPTVRAMEPLLEEEEDRSGAEDLESERTTAQTPRTGEDFFDDAASPQAEDDAE